MKTFSTLLWAVLLIAIFSTLFYWMGKALIEVGKWLVWRLKLQKKRLKEARLARESRNNLKTENLI